MKTTSIRDDLTLWLRHSPVGDRCALRTFSDARLEEIPPYLLFAARSESLEIHAVRLAVTEYVEPRGPGMPQPEQLLTYFRGRLLFGKDQMAAFALERTYVGGGIYGWEQAASECFAKPVDDLSLSDAATLIYNIRSPENWNDQAGRNLEGRNALLGKIAENGYVPEEIVTAAIEAPLTVCGN